MAISFELAALLGHWEGKKRKTVLQANANQLVLKLFVKISYMLSF
jgi:hypothetical protein